MEISELLTVEAHGKGALLDVLHPRTGEKTDLKIILLGADSKAFREIVRERERLRTIGIESPEEAEARDLEIYVKAATGWEGMTENEKPMPFTKDNVRRLYEQSPSIRIQAQRFVHNRGNFPNG